MSTTTALVIAFLLLALVLLVWFIRRARSDPGYFPFRPIAAFQALEGLLGQAVESGKAIHLSLGTAGLGTEQTVIASVALAVLRYLAAKGAAFRFSPTTTVADPTLMLAAQDALYRAYDRAGATEDYRPTDVQLIAPEPTAYAIGAQDIVSRENVTANVMLGHFGLEYLLLAEPGAQRDILQVAGSNTVNTQPFLLATADHPLLGEEPFAAGAYLTRRPEYVASLRVQDILRLTIVTIIILGVVVTTVLGPTVLGQ